MLFLAPNQQCQSTNNNNSNNNHIYIAFQEITLEALKALQYNTTKKLYLPSLIAACHEVAGESVLC